MIYNLILFRRKSIVILQPTLQKYCSNLSPESPCTARKKVEAACHPACLPALTLPSPSPVLSFGGRLDCRGDKLLSHARTQRGATLSP